jgi:hypothetical protein
MREHGYLSSLQPSLPTFSQVDHVPAILAPLWQQLCANDIRSAQMTARSLLRKKTLTDRETLAALLNGAAVAELRSGNLDEAHRLAKRAAGVYPDQWMAHAIRIAAFDMSTGSRAYRYAAASSLPTGAPAWDEIPSRRDHLICSAALAWRCGFWDDVARCLETAYPAGVATMPEELQADAFRLAFYRNQPSAASAAARAMLGSSPIDQLDQLLNAMVQNGWTSEALPLYREAYERNENSQLLRRRLVGLCIREGELEEARRLASAGALNIVV